MFIQAGSTGADLKSKWSCGQVVGKFSSHIVIVVILLVYALLGGLMFSSIEQPLEIERASLAVDHLDTLVEEIVNRTLLLHEQGKNFRGAFLA